ncbi:sigma factor [Paenibacillus sp. BR1-192]|uniref:RNA polymerase sigma factor n=1 Tax=Paenibacillus sp. BR1-192 TaxID=3032287 RepID=UPI00240E3984|nr:sigma factor [Paenibacillus sp. BR1-192]WFB61654.1 sigma factor [Paenibacillus sp. BR1-192]
MKLRSNETFFVDVFRKYFTRVLNYCKRLMRGQAIEMAEECAQNTFVQVQENITALQAHPNLAGWLCKTARNQVNAYYRKLYRRRKYEIAISDSIANQLTANSCELYEVLIGTLDMNKMVRHVLQQLSRTETEFYVITSRITFPYTRSAKNTTSRKRLSQRESIACEKRSSKRLAKLSLDSWNT